MTDLLPMLEAISITSQPEAGDPGMPASPVNADVIRILMAIETWATGSPHSARRASLAALAERDRVRDGQAAAVRPAAMASHEFAASIVELANRVAI